jgi:type VI protein secretion system component VasK
VARDLGYGKYLTELRAHQLSTLAAAILFSIYAWAIEHHWPLESAAQAIMVGAIWFVLTIAFEIVFGRYVAKHSWAKIVAAYDLRKGQVWPLLLLWLFVLPSLVHCLN